MATTGRPAKMLAILTCMDARLEPTQVLGLSEGDAHVIRNAGGVASEDALRSLIISQRLLGTTEIAVIHHTDCGMEKFNDDDLSDEIARETGIRPGFSFEAFPDAEDDVRVTIARLVASPFLLHGSIRGYLYDVEQRTLREIARDIASDKETT